MNREIDINKFNKSITFQNRGIGFTQIGIAGEILDLIDDLQQENKQLKKELQQFQYDFEQKIIDYFKELEEAINETDLSDKTRNNLVELMYKDENRVFGFVEEKIDGFCEILGDKE